MLSISGIGVLLYETFSIVEWDFTQALEEANYFSGKEPIPDNSEGPRSARKKAEKWNVAYDTLVKELINSYLSNIGNGLSEIGLAYRCDQ